MAIQNLYTSMLKELLLLKRDKTGLVLLFIMPAILVVLITLIQDKVTTTDVQVLFVDNDKGSVAEKIHTFLESSETIKLTLSHKSEPITAKTAKELVASGQYQFAIILPEGLSTISENVAKHRVTTHLFPEKIALEETDKIPEILLWFDPTVHGSFRAAINSTLSRIVQGVQTQMFAKYGFELLPEKLFADMPVELQNYLPKKTLNGQELLPQLFEDTTLIPIQEQFTTEMGFTIQPTAVQQNVPAWAIFGVFLIVVPLSSSIIGERNSGIIQRLKILPVNYSTIITGKLLAYLLVCLTQFFIIVLAGIYGLPLLDLPAFTIGNSPFLFFLLVIAIGSAACGYGTLLGTICKTSEQSAVLGPISIVIGAAIGGIMVPVYALPNIIKSISIASPLYWGQSGFNDILLREGTLQDILPEISLLLSLCCLCMVISYLISTKKR